MCATPQFVWIYEVAQNLSIYFTLNYDLGYSFCKRPAILGELGNWLPFFILLVICYLFIFHITYDPHYHMEY